MKNNCPQCKTEFDAEKAGGLCPACLASMVMKPSQPAAPGEAPPLKAGETFHGLEILELIGQGGMGFVYKARQTHLDRIVALKVLPRSLGENADFVERFRREAKALASLNHPAIVTIHDFGVENTLCFFVMEFVDGVNLRRLLQEKNLKPEEAMRIVPELCGALEYAHGEGFVHRDIKPENILLDRKGRVKIADFGLAKIIGGEGTRLHSITQSQMTMGTVHYMAPEQLENPKSVDHRADIYSMGVVFYEMLTGELPLGRFQPPSKKVEVDVRLDEIVLKALEKEPERRYQQAVEVRNDVTRITQSKRQKLIPAPFWFRWSWYAAGGFIVFLLIWNFINRPPASSSPSSDPTLRIEQLFFTEDDLPGLATFIKYDDEPRAPLLAGTPVEIAAISKRLDEFGFRNFTGAQIRRAYFFHEGHNGNTETSAFALEAADLQSAEMFETSAKAIPAVDRWVHRRGTTVVFIINRQDYWAYQVNFRHLVNRTCEKLGLEPPYKEFPGIEIANLTEDDLPPGCSFAPETAESGSNPLRATTPEQVREALSRLHLTRAPEEIRAIYQCRLAPHGTTVYAVEIPRRTSRKMLLGSLVVCIGNVLISISTSDGYSLQDYRYLRSLFESRGHLQIEKTKQAPDLRMELIRAAAMPISDYRDETGDHRPVASIESLEHQNLTALIRWLARPEALDIDCEWLGHVNDLNLCDNGTSLPSILSGYYMKGMEGNTVVVDAGKVRFRVEFTLKEGRVVEFKLPKSGRRVVKQGRTWKYVPPEDDPALFTLRASDIPEGQGLSLEPTESKPLSTFVEPNHIRQYEQRVTRTTEDESGHPLSRDAFVLTVFCFKSTQDAENAFPALPARTSDSIAFRKGRTAVLFQRLEEASPDFDRLVGALKRKMGVP